MGFNKNPPAVPAAEKQIAEQITAAIAYLRQGWNAEAFLLLSEPGAEKEPAARFALGLCHFSAGDLPAAISCFEETINLLKAMPSKPVQGLTFLPQAAVENTETFIKLSVRQIAEKIYLTPMDINFCTHFPKAALQTALLALIDSYVLYGKIEEARRLSAGLIGPVFEEYKKNLGN